MNDFDFLVGHWTLTNRRRREFLTGCDEWDEFPATSKCERLFDGAANIDWITFSTLASSGLTLRLFDPGRQEWSLYWASSRDGILQPPVVGNFIHDEGTFYGDDTFKGRVIRVRYIWSDVITNSPLWEQAFSTDNEQTWETNWTMTFART
jgi:hypothetical protein